MMVQVLQKFLISFLLFSCVNSFSQVSVNLENGKSDVVPFLTDEVQFGNYYLSDNSLFYYLQGSPLPFDTTDLALWLPLGYDYINGSVSGSDTLVNAWYDYFGKDSVYQATGAARPIFKADSGVIIDGVDDYLLSNFDFDSLAEYTINFTVYIPSSTSIVGFGQGSGTKERVSFFNYTDGTTYFFSASNNTAGYGRIVSIGAGWHTVTQRFYGAGTGDSERLRAWADGVEISLLYTGTIQTTTSKELTGNDFRIGQAYLSGFDQGEGTFRDFQIWTIAQDTADIIKYHTDNIP